MNIRQFVSCLNKREMIERKSMTEKEVIDAVKLNKFFGFVECDIEVPHNLRSKFHKMPPIFKNVNISRNDLSPHMKDFAVKTGTLKAPQRSLIGSIYGEKILLLTMRCQVGKKYLLFTCMAIEFSLMGVIFYHIGTI